MAEDNVLAGQIADAIHLCPSTPLVCLQAAILLLLRRQRRRACVAVVDIVFALVDQEYNSGIQRPRQLGMELRAE